MSVQEQIKAKILQEIYGDVDKLYDMMEQRFILSDEHNSLIIRELNKLKDQLYLISQNSRLA